jgi:hypothetical protein
MEAPVKGGGAWSVLSVGSACAIFVSVNALSGRHYARCDVTTAQRFSLSEATVQTLSGLSGSVTVSLVLGDRDPARANLLQLLEAYRSQGPQLDIRVIDPERNAQEMRALYRRTNVNLSAVEDDMALVVEREGRHWFVTKQDLFGVDARDPARWVPREERAVTSAIRAVAVGGRTRLCFTTGHEELAVAQQGRGSIGSLAPLLERDNHELSTVDLRAPEAQGELKRCDVVLAAGPRTPFLAAEAERLRTYALLGGSVLIAAGPIFARDSSGVVPLGLGPVTEAFGILLDDQLVIERDGAKMMPETAGTGFFVSARPHDVTHGLLSDAPRIGIVNARSMRHHATQGGPAPSALLVSSAEATARSDDEGAEGWRGVPPKGPLDKPGPFVLAMASERGKVSSSDAHGPRLIVIGSGYALAAQTFDLPPAARGLAYLTEAAIGWLAKRPVVVDIPDKAPMRAPLVLTEAGRSRVRQYVLLWMPLASALLGLAIFLRRRATERRA